MGHPAAAVPLPHDFCSHPEVKFLTQGTTSGLAESVTQSVCNPRYHCNWNAGLHLKIQDFPDTPCTLGLKSSVGLASVPSVWFKRDPPQQVNSHFGSEPQQLVWTSLYSKQRPIVFPNMGRNPPCYPLFSKCRTHQRMMRWLLNNLPVAWVVTQKYSTHNETERHWKRSPHVAWLHSALLLEMILPLLPYFSEQCQEAVADLVAM